MHCYIYDLYFVDSYRQRYIIPFFFSFVAVLFLGAKLVGLAENYCIPDPFVAIVTIHTLAQPPFGMRKVVDNYQALSSLYHMTYCPFVSSGQLYRKRRAALKGREGLVIAAVINRRWMRLIDFIITSGLNIH